MFNELRKLKELHEAGEDQMRADGFTPEVLERRIEEEKKRIIRNLNFIGWLVVFAVIIPLSLMQLGLSTDMALLTSYTAAGIIFGIILPKIRGRYY